MSYTQAISWNAQSYDNGKAVSAVSTGFKALDKNQPVLPGLYILAGMPGIGKTTFVHQMAEQMAVNGQTILFFSAIEKGSDLYAKSLAREMFNRYRNENKIELFFSPSQIRYEAKAKDCPELATARQAVDKNLDRRLVVSDYAINQTVEAITSSINGYMQSHYVKPVVVIDFLQVIEHSTDKSLRTRDDAVNYIINCLKQFQLKNDLVIFLISGLMNQSYHMPATLDGVETADALKYAADVVWVMQDWIIAHGEFNKQTETHERKNRLMLERGNAMQEIELICLKNRHGKDGYTVDFEFHPASSVFYTAEIPFEKQHPRAYPTRQNRK